MEGLVMRFEEYFQELMKDPVFAKRWEESQVYFRHAEKFHEKRNELGLTIQQLANRCNVNEEVVEDVEFANFEKLDINIIDKIAKSLEIDIEDLLEELVRRQQD